MSDVYANCVLNISAAVGLSHPKCLFMYRDPDLLRCRIGDVTFVYMDRARRSLGSQPPDFRAWVLQGCMLSHRTLPSGKEQVFKESWQYLRSSSYQSILGMSRGFLVVPAANVTLASFLQINTRAHDLVQLFLSNVLKICNRIVRKFCEVQGQQAPI
jgi:hypothetical protein